MEEGRYLLWLS